MNPFTNIDLRNRKNIIILAAFAVVFLALILVSILVLKQPVVAICIAFILQVAIGVFLHHAEIWLHAVVILIELILGVVIPTIMTVLMILLIVMYVGTIVALKFLTSDR